MAPPEAIPAAGPVVKYGIIGASGIAQRRMMPAFQHSKNSVLTAICSRSLDRAGALASQYRVPGVFDKPEPMLDRVDAVYVATPVHRHLDDARLVVEAGKHLLIEKPLARTLAEADQILALRNQKNVLAMEAYLMKFHPAHAAIREVVQNGTIGHVVQARARLGCWYPDLPGAWRQDPALAGGGALMDLGSHLLDLLQWVLGPIRAARALCTTQVFSYPVEDSATVLIEFENGTHGTLEAFFSLPDQAGTGILEFSGTQGRIIAHDTIGQNGGGVVEWETFPVQAGYNACQSGPGGSGEKRTTAYSPIDLYAAQLDAFSQCILCHTAPTINTLEAGRETLAWIERAYQNQML